MLEKLAKQTAVYGISTIVVRFLSYLLTPYYTRVFGQETYGVVTDIYALIPLALTLLTMGMESSYFRFSAKAEEAGGDVKAAKRRLFATTWGVTSLAAAVFFLATAFFRDGIARMMGEAYVAHPEYVVWVGLIILFDVWACIPFSRLREQGRAMTFVGLKAMNVVLNVALAFGFGAAGLFATDFGVGWVFVANLIASVVTWLAILGTADRTVPKINWALLAAIFAYSLPLLVGGLAGTANEFIDRQLIKYLVPEGAMAQLGIYGAITKIAVVMMLFYQMYRLAAEPFFLSNFRKSDFDGQRRALLALVPEREVEPHARQHVGPEHHRKDEDTLAETAPHDQRKHVAEQRDAEENQHRGHDVVFQRRGVHRHEVRFPASRSGTSARSARRWPSSSRVRDWSPSSLSGSGSSRCGATTGPRGRAWRAKR